MPAEQSTQGQLVAEVAVLLGAKNGASPDGVTRDSLAALTQRQLASASKKLGLVSVSKLKKDELAVQVWAAWNALLATGARLGRDQVRPADGQPARGATARRTARPERAPTPRPDQDRRVDQRRVRRDRAAPVAQVRGGPGRPAPRRTWRSSSREPWPGRSPGDTDTIASRRWRSIPTASSPTGRSWTTRSNGRGRSWGWGGQAPG